MINMVLDKFWELVLFLIRPSKCRTRVTFSPSTLHRELLRQTKLTPSNNPFFNFLAEMRLKVAANATAFGPRSLLNCSNLSKTAGHVWKSMSDQEKAPYRMIAIEQRKLKRLRRPRGLGGGRSRKRKNNGHLFGNSGSNSNLHYNANFNNSVPRRNTPRSVRMNSNFDNIDNALNSTYCANFLDTLSQQEQAGDIGVNDTNSKLSLCSLTVAPSNSSLDSHMNSPLTQKVLQAVARVKSRG